MARRVLAPAPALFGTLLVTLVAALGIAGLLWVAPPGLGDWRLEIERRLPREGHDRAVRAVAVGPGGELAASADGGGAIHLWSLTEGRRVRRLDDSDAGARALAFTADGDALVAGDDDGEVWMWRLADGGRLGSRRAPGPVRALAASPGRLALAVDGHGVALWSLPELTPLLRLSAGCGRCRALVFTPDGERLIFTDDGGSLRVASTAEGENVRPDLDAPETATRMTSVATIALDRDGKILAAANDSGVEILDFGAGRVLARLEPAQAEIVYGMRFTAGGDLVLVHADGDRRRWHWRRGEPDGPATPVDRAPSVFAAAHETGLDVAGGEDGLLRVSRDGDAAVELLGPPGLTLAASADGRRVAVSRGAGVRGPGLVEVYHRPEGMRSHRLRLPAPATCLAFRPDGEGLGLRFLDRSTVAWQLAAAVAEPGWPAQLAPCPPPHDRRYAVVVLKQVAGEVVFLRDARTDLLIPLAADYVKAVDVPRRTVADRFWVRFGVAALARDGALVFATARPAVPLPPLLAAVVALVFLPRALLTLRRRLRRVS